MIKKKTVKVKTPKNYRSSVGSSERLQISMYKKTCGGYKLKYPLRYIKIILNCLTPDDCTQSKIPNIASEYEWAISILIDN